MRITQTVRSRKRLAGPVAAASITLMSAGPIEAAADSRETWMELTQSVSVGYYEFRVYAEVNRFDTGTDRYGGTLIVKKDGRVIDRLTDQFVFIVPDWISSHDSHQVVPLGADMTGDGEPNVLVEAYSGGAHCCHSYYVYSVGQTFRRIQAFFPNDSSMAFLNLDDDPALEAELYDFNFAYWKTSFASSPAPRVALKLRDGKYRFAPELMRRPAIPEPTLRREMWLLRTSEYWGSIDIYPYHYKLWDIMLELIYTGHYDRARQFLDEGWPPGFPGKEQFRYEFFDCQLRRSDYWPGVAAMNGIPADPPQPDCPPCPECG